MPNKILIADDSKDQRDLHKDFLGEEFSKFELEFFEDGTSLEERLNGNVNDVKLVITDNNMPRITGIEIIKRYSTAPKFSEIPFILYYDGNKEIGEEAMKNGAFGYILKAGDLKDYFETIKRALRRD